MTEADLVTVISQKSNKLIVTCKNKLSLWLSTMEVLRPEPRGNPGATSV